MTEKEARKKWCPKVVHRDKGSECLVDRCALWVWTHRNSAVDELPREKWQGHCGLIKQ